MPSLLLGAQGRGRQALLAWPNWLLVAPGTPASTCLCPTGSQSQPCPAPLAALWVPGCHPPAMRSSGGGSRHLSSGLRDAAKPWHPQCSSARLSCAGLPAQPRAVPGPQRPSELVAAPSSPCCGHFAVEPCLRHQSWCWKPSEHPCLLIFHWPFHCLLETQSPPGRSAVPPRCRRPRAEHGCCCHGHVVTSAGGHLQSQPQSWAVLNTAWPGWQNRLGGQAEPHQQQ